MPTKRTVLAVLVCTGLIFHSCVIDDPPVPVPDLNPGTPEGGEILIYDIGDVIEFTSEIRSGNDDPQFRNFYREYDLFDNGSIDLRIRGDNGAGGFFGPANNFLRLHMNSEVLSASGIVFFDDFFNFPEHIVFLPVDALTGGSMPDGVWAAPNSDMDLLSESHLEGIGPWATNPTAPDGISYIATRTKINGEYFYGWIEVFVTDQDDADTNEFYLISRFGISQTPGLRLRMGQE